MDALLESLAAGVDVMVSWMAILFAESSWQIVGDIISLLFILTLIRMFWIAHKSPKSIISLEDLFAENGHIGGSKMRINLGFLLIFWVIVFTTLKGTLQEWLVVAFIGILAWDRKNARETQPDILTQVEPPTTDKPAV
jgi:hypothetical protein